MLSKLKKYNASIVFVSCLIVSCTSNRPKSQAKSDSLTPTIAAKAEIKIPQLSEEDSLDLKIGQMIMIGNDFKAPLLNSDSLLKEISIGKVGGVILFEKNISPTNSASILKANIDSLQAKAKIPLLISIDEEGGKVHRLKEKYGFVKMPSAMYLGKIDNADSTSFYNNQLAAELKSLGINMNYAPLVDVAVNENNPVIFKLWRSYSNDPVQVAKHAKIAIQAHNNYNVATVIKHFPGHGSSNTDSHLGLTDVSKTWSAKELYPFKNLIAEGFAQAVMTAHIINTKLDPSGLPATLSKPIITGLLRDSLGFKGVIVSDDMQMYAISKNYGQVNAIQNCINAGVDVLLVGNNVNPDDKQSASQIHKIIKQLIKEGKVSKVRINESYKRIIALKKKIGIYK